MLTIIGIVLGVLAMLVSIIMTGAKTRLYIDVGGIMIVTGGTIAAILVAHPFQYVVRGFKAFYIVFKRGEHNFVQYINEIADLAQTYVKDGMPPIEERAKNMRGCLLKDGLTMWVNGYTREEIWSALGKNNKLRWERENSEVQVFKTMSRTAPAFGMVGTVVGLIYMLSQMYDHPEQLGPGMALALTTTFYGLIYSNLIFSPMADKLSATADSNLTLGHLQIEGLIMVMEKKHPLYIKDHLIGFVPPSQRGQLYRSSPAKNEDRTQKK